MKYSKEILNTVMKTAQMGQSGIRSVLDSAMDPNLRQQLHRQLTEYDAIETEARSIAGQRGWELSGLDPAVRFMSGKMARLRLLGNNTDSRIAGMMIRGCTTGMIKGLRELHALTGEDPRVQVLSQKLLDCERAGIRQMQGFL